MRLCFQAVPLRPLPLLRGSFLPVEGMCVKRTSISITVHIHLCMFLCQHGAVSQMAPATSPLLKESLDKLHMIYPYYRCYRHAWMQIRFVKPVSQVPSICTFKVEAYWQPARFLTHLSFAIHMQYPTVWYFSSCRFVTYHPSKLAWLNCISRFGSNIAMYL